MMTITDMLMIALFIEAIVNALKPIWQEDGEKMTASEYVAMGFGVIFAVSCKINMLAYVVDVETAPWMNYFFYALTGHRHRTRHKFFVRPVGENEAVAGKRADCAGWRAADARCAGKDRQP